MTLTIIHSEAQRLTGLLNTILDLQHLAEGRLKVTYEPVALAPLLERVVALYQAGSATHPVVLDAARPLPAVRADASRLQQVVGNLVHNAIKYSPAGGEVQVAARHEGAQVQVSVQDQGLGLPAAALEQVFDRFYRVTGEAWERLPGTGLGLALVKELVIAQGGQVWAESAGPGRGSTFHLTLPLADDGPPAGPNRPPSQVREA